jgi:hypothetical protein
MHCPHAVTEPTTFSAARAAAPKGLALLRAARTCPVSSHHDLSSLACVAVGGPHAGAIG